MLSLPGGDVPVAPIEVTEDQITIVLPAEVTPWLPAYPVRLADHVERTPSRDGHRVVVSPVRMAYAAAPFFVDCMAK